MAVAVAFFRGIRRAHSDTIGNFWADLTRGVLYILLPLSLIFSVLSFLVAIPSAVKVFNWTATLFKGRIYPLTPMLFAFGFIGLFTIGGLTGVFLATLSINVHLTDTYFVVAHFHYVMVGGTIMGYLGGIHYWWPKMTGKLYAEGPAKLAWLLVFIGFNVTFLIQHTLGLDGMPRRIYEYADIGNWELYNQISTVGSFILAIGILLTVYNVIRSLKIGAVAGPDPWKGNTLEWFSTSPPPVNNFDVVPRVRSVEPMKDIRAQVERADREASERETAAV